MKCALCRAKKGKRGCKVTSAQLICPSCCASTRRDECVGCDFYETSLAFQSHSQVQMARELGMNPVKLGKLDNHKQEPWKLPLPQFIEELYFKRFGKTAPEAVMSIEERARIEQQNREARRATKQQRVAETA